MTRNKDIPIRFFFEKTTSLSERLRLKGFLYNRVRNSGLRLEQLNIIFCSDDYLLNINKVHLGHDYFTDIISFNYADHSENIAGELYISVDRVRENAAELGFTFKKELHRVIFHGVLHFLGYKDKTAAQRAEMRKAEDAWLKKYGL